MKTNINKIIKIELKEEEALMIREILEQGRIRLTKELIDKTFIPEERDWLIKAIDFSEKMRHVLDI